MPSRADPRKILRRAAVALARAAAALLRRARGPAARGRGEPPASPPAGAEDAAFLEHVRDTLRDLSAGPAGPPPRPPPPGRAAARWRARARKAAALLEPLRRHEDVVLTLALLVGIAVMILHWVR